jgi:hypothetical protein
MNTVYGPIFPIIGGGEESRLIAIEGRRQKLRERRERAKSQAGEWEEKEQRPKSKDTEREREREARDPSSLVGSLSLEVLFGNFIFSIQGRMEDRDGTVQPKHVLPLGF